jgi:hypothetical protein
MGAEGRRLGHRAVAAGVDGEAHLPQSAGRASIGRRLADDSPFGGQWMRKRGG